MSTNMNDSLNYWEKFVLKKGERDEYVKIIDAIEKADRDETKESYELAKKLVEQLDQDKYKFDMIILNKKLKTLETRLERQISTDLGSMIRSIREQRGLSLRGLSRLSGISGSYISRIETGERKAPSFPLIEQIAEALNVDMSTLLMAGETSNSSESKSLPSLLFSNNVFIEKEEDILSPIEKEQLIKIWQYIYNMSWSENKPVETIELINMIDEFKTIQISNED